MAFPKGYAAQRGFDKPYQQAMGMLQVPQVQPGQKVTTGPEGQMWQGVQAQQRANQMAANVRGFNPLAARAAAQSGAEVESQARGAAMGIREADLASRRQQALGLAQQRSQFDVAQMGLESQALQQKLQQQAFEDQLRAQAEAQAEAEKGNIISGLISGAAGVGAAFLSDERAKEGMTVADDKARMMLGRLGDGEVVSDAMNRAKFYGEYGDPENPRTALVYTGDADVVPDIRRRRPRPDAELEAMRATERDYAQFLAEHQDMPEEPTPAPSGLDYSRSGIAITDLGEGGPSPEQRISYGTVVPREEFRPQVATREAMPVEARAFNQPFTSGPSAAERAEFTRRMTESVPAASEQARMALERMVREPAGGRTIRPSTYEDAAAARRRQAIGAALDELDAAAQQRAMSAADRRRADIAAALDAADAEAQRRAMPKADQRRQTINAALDELDAAALEKVKPVTYRYRPEFGGGGPQFGVRAQDVARVPGLRQGVVERQDGLLTLDPSRMTGPILGMLGNIGKRLSKVEAKK